MSGGGGGTGERVVVYIEEGVRAYALEERWVEKNAIRGSFILSYYYY